MDEQKITSEASDAQLLKKSRIRKSVYIVLICILSVVMLFCLYKIASISMEYHEGNVEYENIAQEAIEHYETYAIPKKNKKPKDETTSSPETGETSGSIDSDTDTGTGTGTVTDSGSADSTTSSPDTTSDPDTTTTPDTTPDTTEPEATTPEQTTAPDTTPPSTDSDEEKDEYIVVPSVNINYLEYKNPDFTGWIYLDKTILNYPVVQGKDNEYYLDHTFYGVENSNGCIFIDYRLDLEADNYNTIFYGHNMKTGAMFALLKKYARQDYFEAHKYIVYVTEDGPYLISVFSAYTVSVESDSWKIDFTDEEDYAAWLEKVSDASEIDTGITPTTNDRVVTLSTCTFVFEDARFVVHGIIEPLF